MIEVTLIGNLTADVMVRDAKGELTGEKYYDTAEKYARKKE